MDNPDETRTFDHGQVEVVKIGGATIGRYTFEPGWRWSESVKPIAKTDSCQAHHVGYILTGRLHVLSDDGGEAELGPGEPYEIAIVDPSGAPVSEPGQVQPRSLGRARRPRRFPGRSDGEGQAGQHQSDTYPPSFKLSLALKDMRLVTEAAIGAGRDLKLAAASRAWLDQTAEAGAGNLDFSAVVATILGEQAHA